MNKKRPFRSRGFFLTMAVAAWAAGGASATNPSIDWLQLSSAAGDLPAPPGGSTMQTGALTGDFDGDGEGNFTQTVLTKSHGWHEARLADLDGDGDLDVLNKPYNWQTPRVDIWLNNGTRRGARGIGTSASFHGPVGLELYSLREIFAKNVPLGLQFARNFGFVEVELAGTYGIPPEKYRVLLDRYGLKPIGAIYDYNLYANEPEKIIQEAKALGLAYAGCAWIPHDGPLTEEAVKKAAATFNKAGELLAKNGIQFFYHNHGYEFVPCKEGTLFDVLMRETDPRLVVFEMDVFWVVHPAQDPVALLKKYPNRWRLFHVKDMRNTTQTGLLTGGTDMKNDVSIGSGKIDIAAALREATNAGVEHFFIEDESPDVVEQIPLSLRCLGSLQW